MDERAGLEPANRCVQSAVLCQFSYLSMASLVGVAPTLEQVRSLGPYLLGDRDNDEGESCTRISCLRRAGHYLLCYLVVVPRE